MTTGNPLNILAFIDQAARMFSAAGFDEPRREARELLEAVTGMGPVRQLADADRLLGEEALQELEEALQRRLRHVPMDQIRGRTSFDGLDFQVSDKVLSPRPETEFLVEEAERRALELAASKGETLRILDSFTGTGAIGISLGKRLAKAGIPFELTLADLSPWAVELARQNALALLPLTPVRILEADIWPDSHDVYDIMTSNPPYIARHEITGLMPEVAVYEPGMALDGGKDGLDFYRRLAREGGSRLSPGGFLVLEAGAGQAADIIELFIKEAWSHKKTIRDFAGHERVLVLTGPAVE